MPDELKPLTMAEREWAKDHLKGNPPGPYGVEWVVPRLLADLERAEADLREAEAEAKHNRNEALDALQKLSITVTRTTQAEAEIKGLQRERGIMKSRAEKADAEIERLSAELEEVGPAKDEYVLVADQRLRLWQDEKARAEKAEAALAEARAWAEQLQTTRDLAVVSHLALEALARAKEEGKGEAQAEIERLKAELHEWEESDRAEPILGPIFVEEIARLQARAEKAEADAKGWADACEEQSRGVMVQRSESAARERALREALEKIRDLCLAPSPKAGVGSFRISRCGQLADEALSAPPSDLAAAIGEVREKAQAVLAILPAPGEPLDVLSRHADHQQWFALRNDLTAALRRYEAALTGE